MQFPSIRKYYSRPGRGVCLQYLKTLGNIKDDVFGYKGIYFYTFAYSYQKTYLGIGAVFGFSKNLDLRGKKYQ